MPTKPLTPCRAPNCGALVASGYCTLHQRHSAKTRYDDTKRKWNPTIAASAAVHYGANWKKLAKIHKQANPLCCDPFGDHNGFPVPTQQSHHIKGIATHPELAYSMENLAPLCTRCHAKVERIERNGDSTEALFLGRAIV